MSNPSGDTGRAAAAVTGRGRGTSRYVGVSWEKYSRRWQGHITANGRQQNLGYFDDEVIAAKAYDEAARQAFGEFATLNFPTPEECERAARWFDRDAACRFFGVNRCVWKRWVREGRIKGGRLVPSSCGGKRKLYTLEELERMKEELFGEDKLYKDGKTNRYHVPTGLLRREEAWRIFGVEKWTWERWEREGRITCGVRVPSGPKVYRIADIERLLEENGCFSPPYPDPDRSGWYRVPLSGRDIRRREAIIDADALSLIEGATCTWSMADDDVGFVSVNGPTVPNGTPLRRVIMGITSAKWHVGHVNGNPLDCRRANLVVRTVRQRTWTKRKTKEINGRPPTSRFKGVHWEMYTGKWRARIRAEGKEHSLGRFLDEVEAAEAYDAAARNFFGEHAWLNFPDASERSHSRACNEETLLRAAA